MLLSLQLALGWIHQPTITNEKVTQQVSLDAQIKSLSKLYGVDPVLVNRIIGCETRGDPNAVPDPNALRLNKTEKGVVWSRDWSYFQINDYYWKKFMLDSQGLDITKPADNLYAGFWILQHYGTKPWNWSKHCWQLK